MEAAVRCPGCGDASSSGQAELSRTSNSPRSKCSSGAEFRGLPLFESILVFENYPFDSVALSLPGTGLSVTDLRGDDASHYPMSVVVVPGAAMRFVGFRSDVFDRSTVVSLTGRLERLLEAVAADPGCRVGAVDLLGSSERERLLVDWRQHHRPRPVSRSRVSVPELFARQVERVPEATAGTFGDQSLTYAELDAESNRLAHGPWISEGVGPEQITALALPRSIDMIVAILAVLKAGGVYLPLDPAHHPAERMRPLCSPTPAPRC